MDILYEFNTIGIVFTAVVGGLFVLLLLPMIMFARRRKPSTSGTVFYRVLDILLIVALLVMWLVYALCKIELLGFSVKINGDALGLFRDAESIFDIPMMGGLHSIFNTVLGTVLLGALSFISLLTFVMSFTCRRKKQAEEETCLTADEDNAIDAVSDNLVAENAASDTDEPVSYDLNEFGLITPSEEEVTDVVQDTVEDELLEVEVLEDEYQEFVPVEVLSEEASDMPEPEFFQATEIFEEEQPENYAAEEPKELSDEVKNAIRTVVLETPQTVKDALKVVLDEDAFIIKEVLRVIVETETEPRHEHREAVKEVVKERVVADVAKVKEAKAEPILDSVTDEVITETTEPEFLFDNIEEETETAPGIIAATTIEPVKTAVVPEKVVSEAEGSDDMLFSGFARLAAQVSRKMYSSSLRRPDTKKKTS